MPMACVRARGVFTPFDEVVYTKYIQGAKTGRRGLYIFGMENVKSPVADSAEVRVNGRGQKSRLFKQKPSEREVELVVFPKFVPAPSKDELLDLASAYNASLGW